MAKCSAFAFVLAVFALVVAGQQTTEPTTRDAATTQLASTPGSVLERAMQALCDGDESAYRDVVRVNSLSGYSEAHVQSLFAGYRLHRAIQEHDVKGEHRDKTGFDRNWKLSPSIQAPPTQLEWEMQLKSLRKLEWEIDGDFAWPKAKRTMFSGEQGIIKFQRIDGGWRLVITDPEIPAESLQQLAAYKKAKVRALEQAIEGVSDGTLKTIRSINDFVDKEMAPFSPSR